MIKLNLQMFAKSVAYQRDYRKSKAYATGKTVQEELKMKEEKKPEQEKKKTRGEAVTAVRANEEYQVFVFENGKERPYTDKNGNNVYRTGAQVADKMIYNKNREAWESKAQLSAKSKDGLVKIRKYIVRRRVR